MLEAVFREVRQLQESRITERLVSLREAVFQHHENFAVIKVLLKILTIVLRDVVLLISEQIFQRWEVIRLFKELPAVLHAHLIINKRRNRLQEWELRDHSADAREVVQQDIPVGAAVRVTHFAQRVEYSQVAFV